MNTVENVKVNLEDLSKEDLVKKCKSLISLAQKAKTSKETLQEENHKLQELLNQKPEHHSNVTYEIVDKVTKEKLFLVSKIEGLKERNNSLEDKLEFHERESEVAQKKICQLETENISYGRQVERLADENEQLHTDLANFEVQIAELNKLGLQQREELLQLEKTNGKSLRDLQCKLSDSIGEIKKLNISLENKEKETRELSQELQALKIINNSSIYQGKKNCDIYVREINDLKTKNEIYRKDILEIQNTNDKLKDKVKLYHSKLKTFALKIKEMKEGKNQVLQICKIYTEQIKEWKEQLLSASKELVKLVNKLEHENKMLKQSKENINLNLSHELMENLAAKEHDIRSLKEEQDFKNSITEYKSKCSTENLNEELFYDKEEVNRLDNITCEKGLVELSIKEQVEKENKGLVESMVPYKKQIESYEERLSHSNEGVEKTNYKLQVKLTEDRNKTYISSFAQTENNFLLGNDSTLKNGIDLKRENAELLMEMNQMNQALKERGEIISKLESHCKEINTRLHLYETQVNENVDSITEKEEKIKSLTKELESVRNENLDVINKHFSSTDCDVVSVLRAEIESLKEKIDSSYLESETMSTSTISKYEEGNRLKDLEGPWEERYGKLRTLAIKLKAKIRDQVITIAATQTEREELQKKLTNTVKTVQSLQSQIDCLQDEIDNIKDENKKYLNKLNSVAENISKDKQLLVENEETIVKLKREADKLNEEKRTVENWKKQVGAKVQTLRKQLEAKNILIRDYEAKISMLEGDLESKDVQIKSEQEYHKQTKNLLDQTSNDSKKNSVLNLEMQDCERSVKELSQKVEKQKAEINNLQTQFDIQKCSISTLREQNKLLEERVQEEEDNRTSASLETAAVKKRIVNLEEVSQQKEHTILNMTRVLETTRSENEELSTELSKVISEHQKSLNMVKSERDELRNQILSVQQNLREAQNLLKLKEDEFTIIRDEYETYKVRAQSVLKKNQNRDFGLEEKLLEELSTLKSQNNELTTAIKELRNRSESNQFTAEEIAAEKNGFKKRCQELEIEVEELKTYSEQLASKYQKVTAEHAESVRNLKVHAETLSQCYRQQLSEQEVRHNREIIELQSRLDKAPSPIETTPINPSMPREEGEGSESIESNPFLSSVHPIPLERLLDSKSDDEVLHLKKQLLDQESKVLYLTALLSDTEQDLAKHVQMNKLLKEEIRRQQRSVEREKHAENLEYLKNVVFKFVTLSSGDERTRLVPVLNTILKLSPEETQKILMVAKGDPGIKGWTNYLPMWSPNKPQ